jgi:ribosomal protein S28E/S33
VLSDQTAVIGVLKQKGVATGEVEEVKVKFGVDDKPMPKPKPVPYVAP